MDIYGNSIFYIHHTFYDMFCKDVEIPSSFPYNM